MKKTILGIATAALFLAACTNASDKGTASDTNSPATESVSVDANVALVTINGGDDMKYDRDEIRVKEGQTVKLTLHHIGKAPKIAMGHNFVLLASGVSLDDFARDAITAQDNDYIPKDRENEVIVHTKMLGGGESDAIEFPAPEKGVYEFLCSFPGHSGLMRGHFYVD